MNINETIERFSNYHPITREDKAAFDIAIDCMKFTRDFLPLNATPERMNNALNILNAMEYVFNNERIREEFLSKINEELAKIKDSF